MKRLYYCFRGTEPARPISDDLHALGVNDGQLHFMSKDVAALEQQHLHRTSVFQERDIGHSGFYGAFFGAAVGMVFCSYLMLSSLSGHLTLFGLAFVLALFTFFGGWVGGIIGISKENHHIERFHDALEKGETILMLDTFSPEEEEKIKSLMSTKHGEASYAGEDAEYKEFL